MPLSFNEKVREAVQKRGSHLCVGLDPDPQKLQAYGITGAEKGLNPDMHLHPAIAATGTVVQACAPYTAAFKPNAAFFEAEEISLQQVSSLIGCHAPDILRICDAKRGDIGNTSSFYSKAVFTNAKFDAITVNPLMGYDAIAPFLEDPEKGAFLLCLTSNPGASDFLLPGELYKRIADKAVTWNTNGNVGLVVGATHPGYAGAIRSIAPDLPLLIPGIGAQGGTLEEILDAIDARNNPQFLINASRTIMFPERSGGQTHAEAAAAAALQLRDEIQAWILDSGR